MPVYEYRCSKCGNVFERIQKMSDAPLTVHDECGGTVEKLISRSGFHLKGSGWYATDYAKGSSGAPSGGESKSDSNSEAKSDSKAADSKPSDGKAAESKSHESKSSESKQGESKSSESKSSESKPAGTTTKSE
jgi:putative FmdB family regulatory protein